MKVLIIDNYDSFTFNLYQLVGEITANEPVVIKNDMPWEELLQLTFDSVIISPGPGRPEREGDFGLSDRVIRELNVPILGVCLGHQGISHALGGTITHASEPMHGRLSAVYHIESDLFADLPNPFQAVRYHSLICAEPLPGSLDKTAWTQDGVVMGLAHRTRPLWGVQFHPESVCTEHGRTLLKNFQRLAAQYKPHRPTSKVVDSLNKQPIVQTSEKMDHTTDQQRLFVRRVTGAGLTSEMLFTTIFADKDIAFWLDSNFPSTEPTQFSVIGGGSTAETETIRYWAHDRKIVIERGAQTRVLFGDIFFYLKQQISQKAIPETIDLPFNFNCGYVGYFGYELKAANGHKTTYRSQYPDCLLVFVDRCIVIDHKQNEIYLLYVGSPNDTEAPDRWFDEIVSTFNTNDEKERSDPDVTPISFTMLQSKEIYLDKIASCLEHLRNGDSYEICLTNKLKASSSASPLQYYRVLRELNPAPYSAYLKFPEVTVACSSPERFLKITSLGIVETKPIKGTIRRGKHGAEDEQLRASLALDPKNQSENLMIVDLLRNDLGRVCHLGSVSVPKLMCVETYATLHQLVSTITGRLATNQTAVDCLQAAFPGGSMTGAPKIRTMEIIDELEDEARGIYSGSLGYLALNGSADLNIVIRTAVFADNRVSIGVGGAIVAMSDPEDEWEEVLLKAKALISAFECLSSWPLFQEAHQ